MHVVVGTAGASFTKNAVEPKPAWNEEYYYRWGYSRLEVGGWVGGWVGG